MATVELTEEVNFKNTSIGTVQFKQYIPSKEVCFDVDSLAWSIHFEMNAILEETNKIIFSKPLKSDWVPGVSHKVFAYIVKHGVIFWAVIFLFHMFIAVIMLDLFFFSLFIIIF